MYSSTLLPTFSLLCAVAQAANTIQHPIHLSKPILPANTCSTTELLNPQVLCAPEISVHKNHHHHHLHAHSQAHSHATYHGHSHDIDLDDLFEHYEDPEKGSPWTHVSDCIPDGEKNQTYCVFTNTSYANGRGVSFFTTPEIAKHVAALPAFTSGPLPPHVNQFADVPFEVRDIPGRGRGIFATRRLQRNDLILAETPVNVMMSDAFFPDYELGYEYLRKTYDWLPERTRAEFERMSMHKEGHPIMERVNTNSFAGEFGEDAHFWVHPQTAMMNHDCRPNAMYFHDDKTFVHTTVAARTIEEGEEITITYINLLETRASRAELLQVWGFDCSCKLCTSAATANLASEARIAQILHLQEILADWSSSSAATPAIAEKLIKLYAREGLHAALGTGHMFAALAYNALGEEGEATERAQWHAQRAIDVSTVANEDLARDREEMLAIVNRPKSQWSWGVRRRGPF